MDVAATERAEAELNRFIDCWAQRTGQEDQANALSMGVRPAIRDFHQHDVL